MKQLKVGQWWNQFDEMQKEAFISIYRKGKDNINPIRKFLTAAKKEFGEQNPIYGYFRVTVNGKCYLYSSGTGNFYEL